MAASSPEFPGKLPGKSTPEQMCQNQACFNSQEVRRRRNAPHSGNTMAGTNAKCSEKSSKKSSKNSGKKSSKEFKDKCCEEKPVKDKQHDKDKSGKDKHSKAAKK